MSTGGRRVSGIWSLVQEREQLKQAIADRDKIIAELRQRLDNATNRNRPKRVYLRAGKLRETTDGHSR